MIRLSGGMSLAPTPIPVATAPMTDRISLGVLLMLGFCVTAPLIDVASKLAAQTLPVGQITMARFVVQALIMAPVCLILGHSLRIPRSALVQLLFRALFLILSTYCFVAALEVMPIADALAIVFVDPFIILLLGKLIFNDEVGPRRLWASFVGFIGCLFVIQPSLAAFGLVALYPLGTALSFAAYMLITRSLSRKIHPIPMQLHTASLAALMCLPILVLGETLDLKTIDPQWPFGLEWVWMIGVGIASAVAHLMMSYALRFAPSATLAPLHYLEIISAVILGYWIFGDLPNWMTFLGIAIIVGAGLYVVHRERVQERRANTV